jgi:hypothetical protein
MREPDPERLGDNRPALVELQEQRTVFVADADPRSNGWLAIWQWDGVRLKLPPHRVHAVRYVETERVDGDEHEIPARVIAEPDWMQEAQEMVGENTESQQAVIADD